MTVGKVYPRARPRWPQRWLMTDERLGEALFSAIGRLPRGSGVILRHYTLSPTQRASIGRRVARICRQRGLMFAVAGDVGLARRLNASLVHNPAGPAGRLAVSRSVHDRGEACRARRDKTALVFVSPVFATASHWGAQSLGPRNAALLMRLSGTTAIALGGMDEQRFRRMSRMGFHGYAGIDCWLRT